MPLTTLDALLASGARVEALRAVVEPFLDRPELLPSDDDQDDELTLDAGDLRFGPPILRPASLRDFYAFEGHVATMWERRGSDVPEAWYRLPIFYFSNVSEIRGPGDAVWVPRGSQELDYELEIAALVDTPARDLPAERAEEAIGGYMILNDWSARDLQRDETTVRLGPARARTSPRPSVRGWSRRTSWPTRAPARVTRWRPRPASTAPSSAAGRGRTSSSRSGRCWRARRRTPGSCPAT